MWFAWFFALTLACGAGCCAAAGEYCLKNAADRAPDLYGAIRQPAIGYRCAMWAIENFLLLFAYQSGASYILVNICQVVFYLIATLYIGVTRCNEQMVSLKIAGLILSFLGILIYMWGDARIQQSSSSVFAPMISVP